MHCEKIVYFIKIKKVTSVRPRAQILDGAKSKRHNYPKASTWCLESVRVDKFMIIGVLLPCLLHIVAGDLLA